MVSAVTTLPSVREVQSAVPHGYDIIADEYYEPRHVTSRNFDTATRAYLREYPFSYSNHGLALDLGAGRGRLGEYCGVTPTRIVQADVAPNMLTLPEREQALGRVVADALVLPFKAGAFTIVAAFLFDPFNQGSFFSEVARVLNRGGMFIGTIPHYEWGRALRSGDGKSLHEAVFVLKSGERVTRPSILSRPEQLADQLTRAGLHVVKNEALTLPREVTLVSPDIEMPARIMRESVHRIPIVQLVMATKV
jgi:SAM-dependent methyltransferase